MANRGRLDIMAGILGFCTKPQPKTRIMYDANITFNQFGTYAPMLESQGLLKREENKYMTTAKGMQFVTAFNELQNTLNGSDLMSSPNRLVMARPDPKKPQSTYFV